MSDNVKNDDGKAKAEADAKAKAQADAKAKAEAEAKAEQELKAQADAKAKAEADAKAKAEKAAAAEKTSGDMVVVSTNHRQPRRRAGMRFTPEGVTVDAAQLTQKQKEAIQADPHLVVKPIALSAD